MKTEGHRSAVGIEWGNGDESRVLDRIVRYGREGKTVAVLSYLGGQSGGRREILCLPDELALVRQELRPELDRMLRRGGVARVISAVPAEDDLNGLEKLYEKVVIEVIRPPRRLIIFGAGHVGQALALHGSLTGFQVTVVDDRAEFVREERLPGARIQRLASDYATAFQRIEFSANSAVVIVTRGHQHDEICLKHALEKPWAYLGMIGSRRRVRAICDRLRAQGLPAERLERLHAPIGLRIGAATPQEIAIAILAEIIQEFNRRDDEGEAK